jgi:hypothetical protein
MVNWEYNFFVILYKTVKYIKGKNEKRGKTCIDLFLLLFMGILISNFIDM